MLKFRCSSLGALMTNDRSGKAMGQTAITLIEEMYIADKYGKRDVFCTKEMAKGILCEQDSIELLNEVEGRFFAKHSEKKEYSNDFITGHPDIVDDVNKIVWDIKTPWDLFTFMRNEPPRTSTGRLTAYGWQLMGYMWLLGYDKAKLVYCLVNTPDHLVEGNSYRFANMLGVIDRDDPTFQKLYVQPLENLHNVDDIPEKDRVRIFDLERDEKAINAIQARVEEAREYIKNRFK